MAELDDSIHVIRGIYIGLSYKPPHNQHTVLAAFFLSSQNWPTCKVISLATGTKCLPTSRYPKSGEALHDYHAEIVARRAALRWFLEEIVRHQNSKQSLWICWAPESGKHRLRAGVQLNLYISTLPCGDASTRYLAAAQSEEIARLKDSSSPPPVVPSNSPMPHFVTSPGMISRGRDGYSRLGVLRTKPGRADSPPTTCMSCSDKIAAWNVYGMQGALGSHILQPIYIDAVFLGEVPNDDSYLRHMIYEDCKRALWNRVANVGDLPYGYAVHKPAIRFTDLPFIHSRVELAKIASDTSPTNESLCWIADKPSFEVLINGLKRGVAPKHRFRDKSRPLVCKLSLYQLLRDILASLSLQAPDSQTTYIGFKRRAEQYQNAKEALRGPQGPFHGWVRCDSRWQDFCSGEKEKSVSIPS